MFWVFQSCHSLSAKLFLVVKEIAARNLFDGDVFAPLPSRWNGTHRQATSKDALVDLKYLQGEPQSTRRHLVSKSVSSVYIATKPTRRLQQLHLCPGISIIRIFKMATARKASRRTLIYLLRLAGSSSKGLPRKQIIRNNLLAKELNRVQASHWEEKGLFGLLHEEILPTKGRSAKVFFITSAGRDFLRRIASIPMLCPRLQ